MATLVTGGTGFVGANIVKELARAGHQVVCFDLNGPDHVLEKFLGGLADRVNFVQADMLDRSAVERLGTDFSIDKVVHAAVYTVNRVELETQRSRAVIDINIEGTANILELARTLRVQRFLYISSGAVYGAAGLGDQTLNEETPPAPQNLYGITKYASELLTQRYGELHQLSTASIRLSTPYGPMERVTGHRAVMSVFYDWTRKAVRREPIPAAALEQGRDYTYVVDIADGIRTVLDAPVLPHHLYNLTAGVWITGKEILDQLVRLSPSAQVEDGEAGGGQAQEGLPSRGPLSGHRLAQDFDWMPKYDLAAGLAEYLKWRRDTPFLD
jgi:nucleoside-diphosphate-sugar epimerase